MLKNKTALEEIANIQLWHHGVKIWFLDQMNTPCPGCSSMSVCTLIRSMKISKGENVFILLYIMNLTLSNYSTCIIMQWLNLSNIVCEIFSREIRRPLVSFLKASAKTTVDCTERNPSWMLCLPIVNFLDGNLQPFERLDCAKFQDKNTDWWIVRDFETEKTEIKSRKWSRYTVKITIVTFFFNK